MQVWLYASPHPLSRAARSDYHRHMTTEISGLIDPIAELARFRLAVRLGRGDARRPLGRTLLSRQLRRRRRSDRRQRQPEPLVAHARAQGLELHAALLTHTHEDHVAGIAELRASGLPVLAHADAPGGFHDRDLHVGGVVKFGELVIEPIHLPGHDAAQFAYRTGGVVVTGDSIYRHTVAGHSEPSETSFAEHMSGIDGRILTLARDTVILPGHGPATTVADELAANPFIRLFRGDDEPPPPRDCRVAGRSASGRPSSSCSRSTTTAAARHSSASRRSAARSSPAASSTPPTASPGRWTR